MSETRDDLREALARIIEPAAFIEGTPNRQQREGGFLSPGQRSALRKADACIAGPFAPILAQVSALQAEVERLQKVEGEREKDAERVPSGPCWSDKPEPQSVSALRATITSRDEAEDALTDRPFREVHAEAYGWALDDQGYLWGLVAGDMGYDKTDAKLADLIVAAEAAEWDRFTRTGEKVWPVDEAVRSFIDTLATATEPPAPCDRSGEADETRRGSAEGESTVTGAARQAPSDNPLTETKEGSEHV